MKEDKGLPRIRLHTNLNRTSLSLTASTKKAIGRPFPKSPPRPSATARGFRFQGIGDKFDAIVHITFHIYC